MNLLRKFTILSTIALMLSLCLATLASAKDPLVFVSIAPQRYFVEQVAGDTIDVEIMVEPGASPATYEPKPHQMAMLAKADLYLAIGVPFERTWLPRLQEANPNLKIVHIDKGLRKIPMADNALEIDAGPRIAFLQEHKPDVMQVENHEHNHDHGNETGHDHKAHSHKGSLDPHVWLSPRWVKYMSNTMRKELMKIAPEHAKQYRINYRAFSKRLDELDKDITTLFESIPPEKRAFMTFHPSWGYYAMTYNLIQIPIEFEGKAPTPRVLMQIAEIAKKRNLRTIFVQPQFSSASATAIANTIDGNVVEADPLAENWEENLRLISKKLVTSFTLVE